MKILKIVPLSKPVGVKISIPPSKSYTNRALFIKEVGGLNLPILNPLISDDTKTMLDCLKDLKEGSLNINANLSGTTLRFILPFACICPGVKIIGGKEALNKRPIGDLVSALTQMGAKIEYIGKEGFPPIKVLSSKLNPGTVKINGSLSSQYISALLMIAPLVGEVTIEVSGKQVSKPYIDMTIDIMQHFGVTVINKDYKKYIILGNQKYKESQYSVEGDFSSASYFGAIAALTTSHITLENLNPNSKQADKRFFQILEDMGNEIVYGENEITVIGKGVRPLDLDMEDCPDQVQTLAILAAFAKGITKISGVKSLRIKETDRVLALEKELKKMGIKIQSTPNSLTIYGGTPKAATIETYKDHRMAMSFAVAGCKLYGVEIVDPDVVSKTFPNFWKILNLLGVKTDIKNNKQSFSKSKNIILIGMRGSGKTTVGKLLAKKLRLYFIETDELVVKKANLTIPEIVKKFGWERFRQLEHEAVKDSVNSGRTIVSTGGGVVVNSKNIDLLKKNGILFWLRCNVPTLVERVENNSSRPPLTNKKTLEEEVKEILRQRENQYEKAADEIIDTDYLNPKQVADKIIKRLGED